MLILFWTADRSDMVVQTFYGNGYTVDCFADRTWKIDEQSESSPYNRPRRPRRGIEVWLYFFFYLGGRWDEWSTSSPSCFTPENDPVSNVQEAGWTSGPGLDPRTVQAVANRYTHYAIPAHVEK